jgi:hypothetical protein
MNIHRQVRCLFGRITAMFLTYPEVEQVNGNTNVIIVFKKIQCRLSCVFKIPNLGYSYK